MGYLESVPVRAELGQRNRMQLFLLDFLEANFQSLSNFSIEGFLRNFQNRLFLQDFSQVDFQYLYNLSRLHRGAQDFQDFLHLGALKNHLSTEVLKTFRQLFIYRGTVLTFSNHSMEGQKTFRNLFIGGLTED